MIGKRSRLDIVGDMLQAISERQGRMKPTHLMYRSNLSHAQLQSYLEYLSKKGIVERVTQGKAEYIVITKHGYLFAEKVKEMRKFEEGFGL